MNRRSFIKKGAWAGVLAAIFPSLGVAELIPLESLLSRRLNEAGIKVIYMEVIEEHGMFGTLLRGRTQKGKKVADWSFIVDEAGADREDIIDNIVEPMEAYYKRKK